MAKPSGAREAMLEAASELFRARGYEGVGVAELLEKSGAPRGSLYFHFPGGKEQIGIETLTRVGAEAAAKFRAAGKAYATLDEFIDAVFRFTAHEVEKRDFEASCPICAIAAEVSSRNPALRQAAADVFAGWEREIAKVAGKHGLGEAASGQFASALVTAMEGAFVVSKSQRSASPHENAALSLKALANALASLERVRG